MHSLLKICVGCGLEELLDKVECSIIYLMKKKHQALIYNLEDGVDQDKLTDLIRYKRIIRKRLYNCDYPSTKTKTSDIITRASYLALREDNCSQCIECNN